MKKIYKDISLARNVTMMETGVVYLIPAPFCPISKQIYEEAESAIFEAGLAYDYSMQELSYKDIPVQLRAWKNLLKTTIVLPVFMPDQEEFHYLVAHCKKSDITIIIKQMVTDAESMSKESAKNALINLAYNDPDFFEDMLYEEDLIFDDEGLEDTKEESFFDRAKSVGKKLGYMLSHHIFKAFEPGVTMLDMSSMDDCNDICPTCEDSLNEQIASLKETNELIKRFLHNVKKLKETVPEPKFSMYNILEYNPGNIFSDSTYCIRNYYINYMKLKEELEIKDLKKNQQIYEFLEENENNDEIKSLNELKMQLQILNNLSKDLDQQIELLQAKISKMEGKNASNGRK